MDTSPFKSARDGGLKSTTEEGGLGQLQSWHRLNNFLKGAARLPLGVAGPLSLPVPVGSFGRTEQKHANPHRPTHPLTPRFVSPPSFLSSEGMMDLKGQRAQVFCRPAAQNCVGIDGAVMGGVVNGGAGQGLALLSLLGADQCRGLEGGPSGPRIPENACGARLQHSEESSPVSLQPALRIPPFDRFITHHAQRVPLVSPGSLSTVPSAAFCKKTLHYLFIFTPVLPDGILAFLKTDLRQEMFHG
ncbi:hypothetical protein AAFF_G00113620 [Aldrovandia affinis]|uniref:Uncharacterized protein n=1 Tax=Aldrovandia affinis TaxID=143900 RepID=A0AAD7WAU3_9TELE|nr:hypothetical protein AAFF_G00113620 [Aldrovandia affinis]